VKSKTRERFAGRGRGTIARWIRRRRYPGLLEGRPEDLWRELISRHVPGRSFADVGCMWRVDGAYSFHALASGAAAVTGIDINPATPTFAERNAAVDDRVRFVQSDLNDPALPGRVGEFDVVFCSGVLYHVPNPMLSIEQLRRLCRGTLILTTASVMERDMPQAAVFLPYLGAAERARLDFAVPARKRGLDSAVIEHRGYANWLWLPTASCVRAMVRFAGFETLSCYEHRHVTTLVARAVPMETQWGPRDSKS
jgi:2-polyprenyl-3-methyl-5-hydroxy-6-metoxy-1,4-benzoquinol methylase